MQTHNLGYPRIGSKRELKKANESYWKGDLTQEQLLKIGRDIRLSNWLLQKEAGIGLIPVNDFSFYDQVLDLSVMLGVVPDRYKPVADKKSLLDLYFAMARGYQKDGLDVTAMEMTKWFDTNYHYIVPEFVKNQSFKQLSSKVLDEFKEARQAGIPAKPVLIGPVSFLLLGKEKETGFHRLDLLDKLLPVYTSLLKQLEDSGAEWVQIDEPFLMMDLSAQEREAFSKAFAYIRTQVPRLKILLAAYFEGYGASLETVLKLPVQALHLDLVRCPEQLADVLNHKGLPPELILSLGVVDGRNVWKNDFENSINIISQAVEKIGAKRVWIAPSCSLMHTPCDLDFEDKIAPEIKQWLAFSKQKLKEVATLKQIVANEITPEIQAALKNNAAAIKSRKESVLIHNPEVKGRVSKIKSSDFERHSAFSKRQDIQKKRFKLPLFPTTTIGSFPQTTEIRQLRADLKKGLLTPAQYEKAIEQATIDAIRRQERIGIDVLVHGEFERNDMVEYFGELLNGFVFTKNGWVQSYGSRCVKPPIIFGDVFRSVDLSVRWTSFAQKQTDKPMKGMLTGPITILQWSFVRDDQPRSETAFQIGLAIRDEVEALEKAGIGIIQIDEPAIREGLPLRASKRADYLKWAINAFKLSTAVVEDQTQIHTHMCYSEFNDIISHIAAMDADVITIETSRSEMELLKAFIDFKYPNEIGPGVYDIHSPRVPKVEEIVHLLKKAKEVLPIENIWVNPDCGLKTRKWDETEKALENMVEAAQIMRKL